MEYVITPYEGERSPSAWWEGAFNEKELDWLQNKAKQASEPSYIGRGGATIDKDIRRSSLSWLKAEKENLWVFEKLSHVVSSLNAQCFNFDLTGFGEPLQLTNYLDSSQGMYAWHQDFGSNVSRKLSLVLQLSDPSEYEGGNLQLLTKGEPTTIQKKRGHIVVFPSWTLHQVTPVVKGNRQSLVAWISGPKFK